MLRPCLSSLSHRSPSDTELSRYNRDQFFAESKRVLSLRVLRLQRRDSSAGGIGSMYVGLISSVSHLVIEIP
jgi:hypothetical protein